MSAEVRRAERRSQMLLGQVRRVEQRFQALQREMWQIERRFGLLQQQARRVYRRRDVLQVFARHVDRLRSEALDLREYLGSLQRLHADLRDSADTQRSDLRLMGQVEALQVRVDMLNRQVQLFSAKTVVVAEPDAEPKQDAVEPDAEPVKIYRPPGFKLQALAEFLFSPGTYSMVLEPIIRDLQDEHSEALSEHRPWKARYVLLRNYCAFWSAVWAQCSGSVVKKLLKALGASTSIPS